MGLLGNYFYFVLFPFKQNFTLATKINRLSYYLKRELYLNEESVLKWKR